MILINKKKIIKQINLCKNWEEIINYLIYLGKKLPFNKKNIKKKKYILEGCFNKIWIKIKKKKNIFKINGDSNTIIIKGILFIIISIYTNKKKKYILKLNFIKFIKKTKLFKYITTYKKITIEKIIYYIKNKIKKK